MDHVKAWPLSCEYWEPLIDFKQQNVVRFAFLAKSS